MNGLFINLDPALIVKTYASLLINGIIVNIGGCNKRNSRDEDEDDNNNLLMKNYTKNGMP